MIRNLKTLGVALCAVLALTAVVASTASAAGKYTAASYPATGSGTSTFGNDTLIIPETGPVMCEWHYSASLAAPSSHLTVTPTNSGHNAEPHCKLAAFSAAVHMNGCTYTFETPTGAGANWNAPVQIECPTKPIRITVPATGATICEMDIGTQTPGGGVAITNNANDVSVKANVTGISYTVIKDSFGCPLTGTGPRTGASYVQHNAMTFSSNVKIDVG